MSVEPGAWERAVVALRKDPANAELVRACFFDDPLADAARRYHGSSEWAAVRALLPPPGAALDLGAGRGIAAFALALDGWRVTAIEPDPSDVVGAGAIRALSATTGTEICVIQSHGEAIPAPDACFDLVHARQVLHHASDLGGLCREVARVLRPGGRFIATREHVISRESDLGTFLDSHPLHRHYGGEYAYTLGSYLGALRTAHLRVRAVINPWASDVNLYPETRATLKRRLCSRIRWPLPGLVPDALLTVLGGRLRAPGRLYTFVAEKPLHG